MSQGLSTSSCRHKGAGTASSPSLSGSHKIDARAKTILYLQQNHAKFNSPSRRESVFFDECNREIISLTSNYEQSNKTRVVFQSTDSIDKVEFILPFEKRVLSIKLNSTRSVLAYHIERSIIECINIHKQPPDNSNPDGPVKYVLDNKRYVQNSRAKNGKLIGFLWTGPYDLVIITDLSVEFYHLDAAKHRLSHIKMFQSTTNWFVYQPTPFQDSKSQLGADGSTYSILMVSTGSLGNSMQPYMFSRRNIVRLQRFEVEGSWQDNEKLELYERSITIAQIYGYVRLLVLQHESLNTKSKGAQIVLYTVDPISGQTCKTHTLDLDVSGRFAINVLDNLVVAHDQPTRSSFVFDIMIKSTEKSDCPDHFVSLLESRPIRQLQVDDKPVDMYSPNWVFFQPHFIVDAKQGLLTTLKLDLQAITEIFVGNNLILSFLSHRKNSNEVILKKCKQIVANSYSQATSEHNGSLAGSPLAEVSSTFEHLARLVISAPDPTPSNSAGQVQLDKAKLTSEDIMRAHDDQYSHPASMSHADQNDDQSFIEPSIFQEDIQREIFRELDTDDIIKSDHYHFVSSTLLEFIFAVRRLGRNIEPCIYKQLLNCMMKARRHFQIIQLVRGGIFKNSEQLAYSLLSIKDQYRQQRAGTENIMTSSSVASS